MAVLGYSRVHDLTPEAIAYGETRGEFWIQTPENQGSSDISKGGHYAFTASDRAMVEAFHAAAILAGGVSRLPPGHYPQYHPDYFGAVVADLDTNVVEVLLYPR